MNTLDGCEYLMNPPSDTVECGAEPVGMFPVRWGPGPVRYFAFCHPHHEPLLADLIASGFDTSADPVYL